MAVTKVSLSLEAEVVAEARMRAGDRALSSYVSEAVRRRLQHDRMADLLADMNSKAGPVPEQVLNEARQVWRGVA